MTTTRATRATRATRRLLAVLVVSAAALSACAGTPSTPSPAPALITESAATATRSPGSPSPSGDADVARLEQLAASARGLTPAELGQLSRRSQARLLAPCAELSWGAFYCLGLGFRDDRPDYGVLLAPEPTAAAGDLPFPSWLAERVAMPLDVRLTEQAAEVDGAILGLDKARSLAG